MGTRKDPNEYLNEVTLTQYQKTQDEGLKLLVWYEELVSSGDIHNVLFPSSHSLGTFFGLFDRNILFYGLDEKDKIWFAAWFSPFVGSSAFMSLWVRKDLRHSKIGSAYTYKVYESAFKIVKVLFGITKQERLLKVHERIGYNVLGKFPLLWDGVEDAWMVSLTKEGFEAGRW